VYGRLEYFFFCFVFLFRRAGLRRDEGSMEVEWGCIYRETERAAQWLYYSSVCVRTFFFCGFAFLIET
jgi:hypothetical protein